MTAISVVLPAFNAEHHIAEAIDSMTGQSWTDFELIVINDGSTDQTLSIISHMARKDSRIRVISRENRGLAHSLNEGVDVARGQWIARMDADDVSLPHRLSRQMAWLEASGSDMCGSWISHFGASPRAVVRYPLSDAAVKTTLLFGSPFAHPAVMMRTELVRQLRYDPAWEKAEDYDLWQRAAEAGWKMGNVPEVLLRYRVHSSQISNATADVQHRLTQRIRLRQWRLLAPGLGIELAWIDEIQKLREHAPAHIDMDAVQSAFSALLLSLSGEAREVALDHVGRVYIRAASDCPSIVGKWNALSAGAPGAWRTRCQLQAVRLLGLQPHSGAFSKAKAMYLRLKR